MRTILKLQTLPPVSLEETEMVFISTASAVCPMNGEDRFEME
jgi:hypothetical protein